MSDELTTQRIGDYQVLAVLGAGGMGKVYKVRNFFTDRIEAMKIVLPDLAGQNEVVERFLREIKVLARLNHPNIASLSTAQTVGNQLVMVMEFVEGDSLSARVAKGPIPPAEAVNYIAQVLAALSYAHQQHIIHRDIKPANMMVTPQGVVKLMDFGIARSTEDRALTMAGTSLGSLPYMSPEQINGTDLDARADLYAVGVSLYEMVTGTKPFEAASSYALMVAHLQSAPKPPTEIQPGLPPQLNEIILKAMAKNPAERFQNADEFRNALLASSTSLEGRVSAVVASAAAQTSGATSALHTSPISAAVAAGPAEPLAQPSVQAAPPQTGRAAGVNQAWSPADSVLPPPGYQKPSSYRGLYMTLGALIVVAVLVVAGIYGPRWARTRAGGTAPANSPQTFQPASTGTQPSGAAANIANTAPAGAASANALQTASTPAAVSAGAPAGQPTSNLPGNQQQTSTPTTPPAISQAGAAPGQPQVVSRKAPQRVAGGAPAGHAGFLNSAAQAQQPGQTQVSPQASNATNALAQEANAAELEDLENQMDQLAARATAAKESVETLRRQQQAQGFNLRGDISSAEDLVATNMDRAKAALYNKDAKNAKKYMDKAELSLAALEKFLGRR